MQEFESIWWSINLLPDWCAEQENSCTSLWSYEGVGALQVSAYKKTDEVVSEKDISELSEGGYPEGAEVNDDLSGAFKGIRVSFSENGKYWRKWWLCNDSLMLFITYNCDVEDQRIEIEKVEKMISTLKPKVFAA